MMRRIAVFALFGVVFTSQNVRAESDLQIIGPKTSLQTQTFEALKKLQAPESITVWEPHEKKEVTYVGMRAAPLFDALTGKEWRKIEDVILTCVDGYQAVIPSAEFSKGEAFLAFSRGDKSDFTLTNTLQGNEVVPLGPYYLVWNNLHDEARRTEGAKGWPYQVKSVSFLNAEERFPKIAPSEKLASSGKAWLCGVPKKLFYLPRGEWRWRKQVDRSRAAL